MLVGLYGEVPSYKVMLPVANHFDNGLSHLLDRCMSNRSTLQGAGEERYWASILVKSAVMANSEASVSTSKGTCSSMVHTRDGSMYFLVFKSSFSLLRYQEARDSCEGSDLLRMTVDPLGVIGKKSKNSTETFPIFGNRKFL